MTDAAQPDLLTLDPIEKAIEDIRDGKMIVVVDDADRENEGDLIMAAELATPEAVAFMIRHTSGILCAPIQADEARRLHLPPMVGENDAPLSTAFTVSVDFKHGLTTGISAEERCATVRARGSPVGRRAFGPAHAHSQGNAHLNSGGGWGKGEARWYDMCYAMMCFHFYSFRYFGASVGAFFFPPPLHLSFFFLFI